ncbi:MAG: hypothetical protein C0595_05600 [Marinilabiliales bacterium]|nr:MAG: hypothetical protein C0595_05600 [Marinilabiliales bacterium]
MGGLIIMSSPVEAQDVVKTEKKIKVKIISDHNGERVITDTIFVGKSTDDINGNKSEQKNKFIIITNDDNLNEDSSEEVDSNIIIVDDGIAVDFIEQPTKLKKTFQISNNYSGKASDIELRDAGIKNKPDRLNAQNINIEIENGMVMLSFSFKGEKTPKIFVYNVFGDKVFKGKPELIEGSYQIIIDLSSKQHGTYYLQLISGKSSLTEKLKI